jgi:hypothetical protein
LTTFFRRNCRKVSKFLKVETNTSKEKMRFATLSDNELQKIFEGKHSEKTKTTNKWAVSTTSKVNILIHLFNEYTSKLI